MIVKSVKNEKVARLGEDTPANKAPCLHVNTSLSRPSDRSLRHSLVVHGTSGWTNLEMILNVPVKTSGGVLSAAVSVMKRLDITRRLSDYDDNDDDDNDDANSHQTTIIHQCQGFIQAPLGEFPPRLLKSPNFRSLYDDLLIPDSCD